MHCAITAVALKRSTLHVVPNQQLDVCVFHIEFSVFFESLHAPQWTPEVLHAMVVVLAKWPETADAFGTGITNIVFFLTVPDEHTVRSGLDPFDDAPAGSDIFGSDIAARFKGRNLFQKRDVTVRLGHYNLGAHDVNRIRNYTSPAARGRSSLFKVWWRLRI
jgi:hypothetical protein